MRKILTKILPFIQFTPMAVFLYSYKTYGSWEPAFKAGGIAAVVMLVAFLISHRALDRVLLSINCFLIGGAAMFLFNIGWLQSLYGYFGKSIIFVWLLLIGIITTLFSPSGFIDCNGACEKEKTLRYSLLYLAAVLVVTVVAVYFRHSAPLTSLVVPWLALVVFKDFLLGNYLLAGVGVAGTGLLFALKNVGVKGGVFLWIGLVVVKGILRSRAK